MSLRREQIVFAAVVLVLGFLVWSGGQASAPRGGGRGGRSPEFEEYPAPDLAAALPGEEAPRVLTRALFEEPRDTRPLPPLEFEAPPLRTLQALAPPPDPGPAPAHFGRLLRTPVEVSWVSGLFAGPEVELGVDVEGFDFEEGGGALAPGESEEQDETEEPEELSFEERLALQESYKRLYDWIQTGPGQFQFGSIRNEDRFTLQRADRRDEPILFLIMDPATGRTLYTSEPIAYERDRISQGGTAWGLADTTANRLELRYHELRGSSGEGHIPALLAFAEECVELRLEAPRALAIAEEMYRAVAEIEQQSGRRSHRARLGLAHCLEAAFDFERAFALYADLLEEFPLEPELHVALARLEWRFLMEESAEARLREALSIERASFEAHRALGELLLSQGRSAEAVEHLEWANRTAPDDPARLGERADVRVLLGDAQLALGDLAAAREAYGQALRADPAHGRALAGQAAVALLEGTGKDGGESPAGSVEGERPAGFRQLLNSGLVALADGRPEEAQGLLQAAADADPLRAGRAWRALSWLAEVTGHEGHALAYAEDALENDPTDVWSHFQRGRLLADQGAADEAREAFRSALEREVELVDALLALGKLEHDAGRWEDAQRYLERVLRLEPDLVEALLLRGLNEAHAGATLAARETFAQAAAAHPTDPTAAAGLAWCTYHLGDPGEAITLLARLDDNRRDRPDDDPWRVWAGRQIERIQDHLDKAAWSDHFERRTLQNGWFVDESDGPRLALVDGALKFEGAFHTRGRVRVYREIRANQFVSFEASVRIDPSTAARVGLFIAREKQRTRQQETLSEASLSRHRDGAPQARFVQRSQTEPDLRELDAPFPTGEWVRIRIERTGEAADARVSLFLDGVPVVEGEPMRDLGRTNTPLYVGLFAEGENGRTLLVWMDDAELVFREGS